MISLNNLALGTVTIITVQSMIMLTTVKVGTNLVNKAKDFSQEMYKPFDSCKNPFLGCEKIKFNFSEGGGFYR